jgi:acyl carrier protein
MDIKYRISEIFRKVFDNANLVITDEMSSVDINGWDSFAHINLIVAIEEEFGVSFTTAEMGLLVQVGDILKLLTKKGVM